MSSLLDRAAFARYALVLALVSAGAAKAEAHAHLITASPAPGAVVTQAPGQLDLYYTEALEPHFSAVAVTAATGGTVAAAGLSLAAGDPKHVVVPLKPLGAGIYHVVWHATSVDTHKTQGDFSFSVAPTATPSDLEIDTVWARPTPGATTEAAVYLTILNHGTAADRLTGVSSPVAAEASLHTDIENQNVSEMRAMAAVTVAKGGSAVFKPFGQHIMLTGLKAPLTMGESFRLVLHFVEAGDVPVTVAVSRDMPSPKAMAGMKM